VGLVAVAAEGVLDKGRGVKCQFSIAGGAFLNLGAFWWPQLQAGGFMNADGRSKTFDESCDGFGLGDGVTTYCVKRLTEVVDGQTVMVEGEPLLGVLASCYMNNSGKNASLGAPSATAEQEMVCTALRNASLQPSDIEAVEVHGDGVYLSDAIEAGSLVRSLRYSVDDDSMDPLVLTSVKTHMSESRHDSGALSLLRVLLGQQTGTLAPNCHLYALNPHMEFSNDLSVNTELFENRLNVSYVGVTAKGFCGTNIHAITWGRVERSAREETKVPKKSVVYWPGGGGELDDEVVPRKKGNYFIAGTFNRWMPQPMEPDSTDFAFTMVLGDNWW
jgi:acyl transferase domain-containing protein